MLLSLLSRQQEKERHARNVEKIGWKWICGVELHLLIIILLCGENEKRLVWDVEDVRDLSIQYHC